HRGASEHDGAVSARAILTKRSGSRVAILVRRQPDHERGTARVGLLNGDRPAVGGDDTVDDRKAETGSVVARRAGVVEGAEALEHVPPLGGGYPGPVVRHRELDVTVDLL